MALGRFDSSHFIVSSQGRRMCLVLYDKLFLWCAKVITSKMKSAF